MGVVNSDLRTKGGLQSSIERGGMTMKVLLINGSPHLNGCVGTALGIVAEELNKQAIETETIHVGNKDIRGCIACGTCGTKGQCVFDDLVNETLPNPKVVKCVLKSSLLKYAYFFQIKCVAGGHFCIPSAIAQFGRYLDLLYSIKPLQLKI